MLSQRSGNASAVQSDSRCRTGKPTDIAHALVSDYITGATLLIDGLVLYPFFRGVG